VTDADTATALGSGDVPVLATPQLIAWMEAATVRASTAFLQTGQTTVGTGIRIKPDFDQLVRYSLPWSRCRVARMSLGSGSAAVTIWSPAWISMVW